MRFSGKVALVTGAASGIGAATARLLADEGAVAVGVDVAVAEGVRRCDVTDREQVQSTVQAAVEEHGGLDVVANVAGLVRFSRFAELSPADWQRHLDVNLSGPFLNCVLPGHIEPVEIAEAIAYLASDAARSVTGEALVVDLGVVA